MFNGNKYLDFARINLVVRTMADQLDMTQSLQFLDRTPIVEADDSDIVTRFRGVVQAADIIADDQSAAVYSAGSFETVTNRIPNLKIGRAISQEMLNRLNRMANNLIMVGDEQYFRNWEQRIAEDVVHGIRQRMNALIIAMHCDSPTYDRYGIKLSGASWGTPAQLKPTVSTTWDNTSATPVSDLEAIINNVGPSTFGKIYDRVTMTRKCFNYVVNTTEFRNRLSGEIRYSYGANEVTKQTGRLQGFLAEILGVTIELYDSILNEQSNDGTIKNSRALANNKVILSSTANDGNGSSMDFANGIVTESIVGALTGEQGFTPSFGPISYYKGEMNPPTVVCWGVSRGFPRKHDVTATACLTVGDATTNAWK